MKGLDEAIVHIEKIFGSKAWINEIDKTIEKELDIELPEVENQTKKTGLTEKKLDEAWIKSVLESVKNTGVSAREKRAFDEAIEIFEGIDKKLLPAIAIHLPEKVSKEIRTSLREELTTAFLKKGKIDEAIEVIDSCCTEPGYESKDYIKSQIDKSFILGKKDEFNQAVEILHQTLEYQESLPSNERKPKLSAEIMRALGMAYRGQGAYKEAIKWFSDAQKGFLEINDQIGYHNALWGMGILRYLTGEWKKAIKIWKTLLKFFETQSDTMIKGKKPASLFRINILTEYARTLQLSGNFKEAEGIMNKALTLAQKSEYEYSDLSKISIYLLFSELYYQQQDYEKASEAIMKARKINREIASQEKEGYDEFRILKSEIIVLLALNQAEVARKKLLDQRNN